MKKSSRKKQKIQLVVFVLVVLALGTLIVESYLGSPKVCIQGLEKKCFHVEVADSSEERTVGLSGRESLREDSGMLFVFDEAKDWGFWMPDMEFPLDIIWIGEDEQIIAIGKNLEPCLSRDECPIYFPGGNAKYVLEINGGLSDKYGFEEGNIYSKSEQ